MRPLPDEDLREPLVRRQGSQVSMRVARGSVRNPTLAPQLEKTYETPQSSGDEGLLFLHGLESNPGSSLQTEEEAGLP